MKPTKEELRATAIRDIKKGLDVYKECGVKFILDEESLKIETVNKDK